LQKQNICEKLRVDSEAERADLSSSKYDGSKKEEPRSSMMHNPHLTNYSNSKILNKNYQLQQILTIPVEHEVSSQSSPKVKNTI